MNYSGACQLPPTNNNTPPANTNDDSSSDDVGLVGLGILMR